MTINRILVALLVLNLFATLLVFRGVQVLVDYVDASSRADAAGGPAASAQGHPVLSRTESKRHDRTVPEGVAPAPVARTPTAGIPAPLRGAHTQESTVDIDDIERIKSQFAGQYIDSGRAAEVHQVLARVAQDNPAYTGIIQELVECKERVCKLRLGYSDPQLFDEFAGQLTEAFAGDLSASLYFEEPSTVAGNSRVELYLVSEQPLDPGVFQLPGT